MVVLSTTDVPYNLFLSMLSQAFHIIIVRGVIVPGHIREVVDVLNDTKKGLYSS